MTATNVAMLSLLGLAIFAALFALGVWILQIPARARAEEEYQRWLYKMSIGVCIAQIANDADPSSEWRDLLKHLIRQHRRARS